MSEPRIVAGEGQPEKVVTSLVSPNLFSTLGVAPLHGRSFRPSVVHVVRIAHRKDVYRRG